MIDIFQEKFHGYSTALIHPLESSGVYGIADGRLKV